MDQGRPRVFGGPELIIKMNPLIKINMFFKKNLIFIFVNKQILITQKTQKVVEQQQDISTEAIISIILLCWTIIDII
jgi:hypothetical protein